jgi:hypothetical protein
MYFHTTPTIARPVMSVLSRAANDISERPRYSQATS